MSRSIEDMQKAGRILVLGGTGKTGRRVAARLAARDVAVRIGSRNGTPPFDWADPATWAPALQDVAAAYITYQPDLAAPEAEARIRAFAELAARHGLRRLVLLSGRGEEEAARSEQGVRNAGIEWTILRASWFAQNFSEGMLCDAVLSGTVALPVGHVAEPFVDVEDIADIAVAALTEDGHAGRLYELTGPRLLTFAEAIAAIARATGRDISYVPLSTEQFAAALIAQGVPADQAVLLSELFAKILDGRNAHLTDGVECALGRRPRDFADYVRAAAAGGAWNAERPA